MRRVGRRIATYLGALAVLAWVALPLYWMVVSSIEPPSDLLQSPTQIIPHHVTFGYYEGIFHNVPGIDPGTGQQLEIPRALLNSIIIGVSVLVINIAFGTPASYALSRFRFKTRKTLLNALLASRLVPSLVLLIPFYLLFHRIGLINTVWGVVIAHVSITLPFTIWILRGSFDNIPVQVEQAARVDGCGRVGALWRVAIPLVAPGIVVAALFAFMTSWNEFALALVLAGTSSGMPVQPVLAGLNSFQGINYEFLFAGSVLAAIPPVLIALALQRRLVGGLTEGAVK